MKLTKNIIIALVLIVLVLITGCEGKEKVLLERNLTVEDFQINISVKDLIIKTDKEVYTQGEYVYFVVYNGFDKNLQLGGFSGCEGEVYSVSKYENGEFKDYIMVYGSCEGLIGKRITAFEIIMFKWDQNIYKNLHSSVKKNVGKSLVRIKVGYVKDSVFIEKESNEFKII